MRVLILGGTGTISTGIVKHLLARGAEVAIFNRGQRLSSPPAGVEWLRGDRGEPGVFAAAVQSRRFDAVIDMICFTPEQARATIEACSGRVEHVLFCSTVCTYGVKIPPGVLVDERFLAEPISDYGKNKLVCERMFLEAGAAGRFAATVVRPSSTYGPGSGLINQLEFDPPAWGRIERGLPVLCAGDGLGLWQATHRDDCGQFFAHAVLEKKTYGQAYNATRDEVFTWRDYYRQAAEALGRKAELLFAPASFIVAHDRKRFGLLAEITQFHGGYDSSKAKRDVPAFRASIGFVDGARETLTDMQRRGVFKTGEGDALYDRMVARVLELGVKPEEA